MPRTDTNQAAGDPITSLFRVCAISEISAIQSVYLQQTTGVTVIVTTIDVVNVAGGSGSEIAVGVQLAGGGSAVNVFGAQTGAGAFDTFSWRGHLALYPGDRLAVLAAAGTWDVSATGYRIPQVFTF